MHKASHSLDQGMVLSSLCLAIRKAHLVEDMGGLSLCQKVQGIDLRLGVFWTEATRCSALRNTLGSQMNLDIEWLILLKTRKFFTMTVVKHCHVFQSGYGVSTPGGFQNSYGVLMCPWATCTGREIELETSRSPSDLSYSVTLWCGGDVGLRRTYSSGDARNAVLTGGYHWRVHVTWKLAV